MRNEYVKVNIETACAHCGEPMEIEIDSELVLTTKEPGCEPIAFVPDVNVFALEDDSIIHAF